MLRNLTLGRVVASGLLGALLATVAVALVRSAALALLDVDPGFAPLQNASALVFTLAAGVGATLVLGVLSRASERPVERFLRISAIVLILSLIPDLVLLIARGAYPGTSFATVGVLVLMHFVAAAVIVVTTLWMLTGERPFPRGAQAASR